VSAVDCDDDEDDEDNAANIAYRIASALPICRVARRQRAGRRVNRPSAASTLSPALKIARK